MIRVAGLDLSLTESGVALLTPGLSARLEKIGRPGLTNLPVAAQIRELNQLADLILEAVSSCSVAAVEALDNAQAYGGSTERTVLWWKVVEGLHLRGVPVWTPTSAQVKMYATGSGRATKGEVIEAVTRHWPWFDHRGNNNLADAAAIAVMAAHLAGEPIQDMPATHTRGLPKVRQIIDPPSRVAKRQVVKR